MHLSILKLWNFRKYNEGSDGEPGLLIHFHKGVNVLVGENDSGKTAIIDAIRYALKTQSGEFIQFDEKDFYQDPMTHDRKDEFKIECIFDGLTKQDSGLFWEWLSWDEEHIKYQLKVWLCARRKDNVIRPVFSAGIEGQADKMDTEARELLKVVYFKPLRDALTDMTHGYKSRFAQILGAHELFKTEKGSQGIIKKHNLEKSYENLRGEIESYFKEGGAGNSITGDINGFLKKHFLLNGDNRCAMVKLTGGELTEILRQLDLVMEGNKSGLGTLNLLCIAAEMLLFKNQKSGLKLALVEELEAHLHPQYQLRLIDYISSQEDNEQFILTTHSITLASKIKLENLIILKGDKAFPMSRECTGMSASDNKFLERFLDATKANLFFAKGLIMVEGDAENLLIPALAELIDLPLSKYGVSVVNVGSTAYKRYVNIFKRKDSKQFGMPISVVSDLDIRALEYYKDERDERIIPKCCLKNTILDKMKAISLDVNYNAMSEVFSSCSAFEEELRTNKTEKFKPVEEKVKLYNKLYKESEESLTARSLSLIREEKAKRLKNCVNADSTQLFLPESWTLEYEIAGSGLYRLLAIAIKMAKNEERNSAEIDCKALSELCTKIKKKYPDDYIPTLDDAYEIFKPLNDGDVSKAVTAQYLAGTLLGEFPVINNFFGDRTKLKSIVKSDEKLKYLVDAIKHVTK